MHPAPCPRSTRRFSLGGQLPHQSGLGRRSGQVGGIFEEEDAKQGLARTVKLASSAQQEKRRPALRRAESMMAKDSRELRGLDASGRSWVGLKRPRHFLRSRRRIISLLFPREHQCRYVARIMGSGEVPRERIANTLGRTACRGWWEAGRTSRRLIWCVSSAEPTSILVRPQPAGR